MARPASLVEPLPHQITAVYEEMLPRQPLRFLLLTATPHNGKEADCQLFMALLDGDRFEARFRDGVHQSDTSDLMRRLIKEQLLTFECTPLFPERWAYTAQYQLSPPEAALYREVTEYVREEMSRADGLAEEGEKRRGNTVGFALTVLQRRLASSPEAIYRSLRRWREHSSCAEQSCGPVLPVSSSRLSAVASFLGDASYYNETLPPCWEASLVARWLRLRAGAARVARGMVAGVAGWIAWSARRRRRRRWEW